jgi:hypothetical protein
MTPSCNIKGRTDPDRADGDTASLAPEIVSTVVNQVKLQVKLPRVG